MSMAAQGGSYTDLRVKVPIVNIYFNGGYESSLTRKRNKKDMKSSLA
jgi:hypothetical protein